jgi:hypothetical protein
MALVGAPLVRDVNGRALIVTDNDKDEDQLSSGVISCRRLLEWFNLDVGCEAVELPVVCLWPMGDHIVV